MKLSDSKAWVLLFFLLLLPVTPGCDCDEETVDTPAALIESLQAVADQTDEARAAGNGKKAAALLAEGNDLWKRLDAICGEGELREAGFALLTKLRKQASLTIDEAERQKRLKGWKARTYRTARKASVKAGFAGLALAAEP